MEVPADYIYLDHNATTPICEIAVEEINKHLRGLHGNPSSSHILGQQSKAALIKYRHLVASCFGVPSSSVIYMSGGTEVNNTVIRVAVDNFWDNFNQLPVVITSKMEHPSILKLIEYLEVKKRIMTHWLPIDPKTGIVEYKNVSDAVLQHTCLITIMKANNETGVIQPVEEIFAFYQARMKKVHAHGYEPIYHTDASQAIGRIPVSVFDVITVTGHKFGGPCIAALVTKNEKLLALLETNPLMYGGGQEMGFRSGTENLPMVAGLSVAIKWATDQVNDFERVAEVRDYFETRLSTQLGAATPYCDSPRLPNTASVCFYLYEGLAGELLERCMHVFAASTGAACHSDGITISPCLLACGRTPEEASKTIRFSLGRENTKEQMDKVIEALEKAMGGQN